MVLAKKWVREKQHHGLAKLADFKLVSEALPDTLEDGEVLCEAEWLSVDPYMRTTYFSLNDSTMPGTQVARIIKSRHPKYPEGTQVVAQIGWRDRTIVSPDKIQLQVYFRKMPELQGLPDSYALGALGMTGVSAYFGLEKVLKIKPHTTIVVSAAGGAVGSVAAQIAKIKGCKVIGLTGSFDKVQWLKSAGIEHAFDYNIIDIGATLREVAPDGVDYYFDNTGGELSFQIMQHMKVHGKIALSGAISTYNIVEFENQCRVNVPFDGLAFINKRLSMEGFLVTDYPAEEWTKGIDEIREWIKSGKMLIRETVFNGFEHMPHALINLFQGGNTGKQIVKALS